MTQLDNNLLPDEQILYRTKKHWIIFFVPAILTIAAFFFFLNQNEYVSRIAALPAFAAVIAWINQFLLYITSEFAVTNKRIMMREGFFFKHTNETRLSTIANASVYQSLIGQILHYGAIEIQAFGGSTDPFLLIANPNEFQKQLQGQLDRMTK
jgi:uncharacterized membrane protein YdbT with pleckstrin-like domain